MVKAVGNKVRGASLLTTITAAVSAARRDATSDSRFMLGDASLFRGVLAGLMLEPSPTVRQPVEAVSEEVLFTERVEGDGYDSERAAAALLEVIALAATRQDDDTLFFHYWLSERIRFLLGPRGFDREKLGAHVLPLRSRIQNMITLGINLRGRPAGEFLAARFAIAEESGNQVSGSGAVLDALVSSASFAGAGLLETIDVLSLVPGCADDACMTFARLAGLFYGEKRLLAIRTFGEPLSAFLAPAAGAGGEEV